MIPDPITLGVSGNVTVYNLSDLGPGSRTKRVQTTDEDLYNVTFQEQALVISHEEVPKTARRRSMFRIDVQFVNTNALAAGTAVGSGTGAAYLVLDLPSSKGLGSGDRDSVAKYVLARILGFLSENATGAPDFDFSSNENVLRFIGGEP